MAVNCWAKVPDNVTAVGETTTLMPVVNGVVLVAVPDGVVTLIVQLTAFVGVRTLNCVAVALTTCAVMVLQKTTVFCDKLVLKPVPCSVSVVLPEAIEGE